MPATDTGKANRQPAAAKQQQKQQQQQQKQEQQQQQDKKKAEPETTAAREYLADQRARHLAREHAPLRRLIIALASILLRVVTTLWSLVPVRIQSTLAHLADKHRYVIVCLVLLPASVLFTAVMRVRRFVQYRLRGSQSRASHMQRVHAVQEQVRAVPDGIPMCTARPVWLAMSFKHATYKAHMANIDVGALDNVLEVDERARTVYVEPNCSMGQITHELIPRGWTLAVTPELDDLTVGGLVMGFGIETSSHRHGLFQHTCTAFEIVLPSGEMVRATATENPELFAAIPWSHGTLGFLVGVEVKIVPAEPYVQITYLPCHSLDALVQTFTVASRSAHFDFVEALQYSKERGVVMVGKMCDRMLADKLASNGLAPTTKVNAIGKFYKPWFFKHAESFLDVEKQNALDYHSVKSHDAVLNYLGTLYSAPSLQTPALKPLSATVRAPSLHQELIPLRDYFHRHTKAIFWELQDIVPFGNDAWFRYLFGWAVPPHISLLKLTTTESLREMYDKAHVIQDMLVPVTTLKSSILKFHQEFALYPLWLCPMRLLSPPSAPTMVDGKPANADAPGVPRLPRGNVNAEPEYELACPIPGGMCSPTPSEQLYVDIGAYGIPQAPQWASAVKQLYNRQVIDTSEEDEADPALCALIAATAASDALDADPTDELHVRVMRRIENFVRANHGYQALYAECFQTRAEFRRMFDHGLYERLRERYGCKGRLPEVFDKVNRSARK